MANLKIPANISSIGSRFASRISEGTVPKGSTLFYLKGSHLNRDLAKSINKVKTTLDYTKADYIVYNPFVLSSIIDLIFNKEKISKYSWRPSLFIDDKLQSSLTIPNEVQAINNPYNLYTVPSYVSHYRRLSVPKPVRIVTSYKKIAHEPPSIMDLSNSAKTILDNAIKSNTLDIEKQKVIDLFVNLKKRLELCLVNQKDHTYGDYKASCTQGYIPAQELSFNESNGALINSLEKSLEYLCSILKKVSDKSFKFPIQKFLDGEMYLYGEDDNDNYIFYKSNTYPSTEHTYFKKSVTTSFLKNSSSYSGLVNGLAQLESFLEVVNNVPDYEKKLRTIFDVVNDPTAEEFTHEKKEELLRLYEKNSKSAVLLMNTLSTYSLYKGKSLHNMLTVYGLLSNQLKRTEVKSKVKIIESVIHPLYCWHVDDPFDYSIVMLDRGEYNLHLDPAYVTRKKVALEEALRPFNRKLLQSTSTDSERKELIEKEIISSFKQHVKNFNWYDKISIEKISMKVVDYNI